MNPLSTWTYFSRHKRHASTLLGLSVVVTMGIYAMIALVWGVFVEPGRLAYKTLSRFSLVTPWSDESGLEQGVIARIRAHSDVAKVIPTTVIRIELPSAISGNSFQFDLLGLMDEDVPSILERFDSSLMLGGYPKPGSNELMLSADVATMLGVKVGDTYDVMSAEIYPDLDIPLQPTPFEVVGLLESDVELGILSLDFLRNHALYHQFPARFIVIAQENRADAVDDFLRNEILSLQTSVMTLSLLNERILSEALPGLVMLLPVVLIVALAFSVVIVVVNQIANARRLSEFGVLHAAGLSKSWLTRRLTRETGTMAVVGWIIGIGLSWGVMNYLKIIIFAPLGHDLNYPEWLSIVFSLLIPLVIAGFTYLTVSRTFARLDTVTIIEQSDLTQEGERKHTKPFSESSPKPLAPVIFYQRHRRRAALLIGGTSLMILAVVLFIFVLAVNADAKVPFLGYLRQVSIVRSPGHIQSLDQGVVSRVEAHRAVERIIPIAPRISMLNVYIPPFTSTEASPFGVYAEDMAYLIELYGLELIEGRLPNPGTNEMVIPETLAQNRDLEIGDMIGDPDAPAYPGAPPLPVNFIISGIFARSTSPNNENGWGFISLEYLEDNQSLPLPETLPLVVVPKEGQKSVLDDWLEEELVGDNTAVLTHRSELSRVQQKVQQDMQSIALLEGVIAIVAAIGLAALNHIFIAQRQSEFGVLYALGYGRKQLVRRIFGETSFTIVVAWGLSAVIALIAMLILRFGLYEPRGLVFNLFNIVPWFYTLPIPLVVLAITTGSTVRTLSKLDPISIIEKRV